jgi:hypothetical protein
MKRTQTILIWFLILSVGFIMGPYNRRYGPALKLDKIRDVEITEPVSDLEHLEYDSAVEKWVNVLNLTMGGYIDMNGNGIVWDLANFPDGTLTYDSDDATLNLAKPGGTVSQQIGEEFIKRVKNVTGSTITNGTPVYISGTSGNLLTVAPADASYAVGVAFRTYAIATEDIEDSSLGYVTKLGLVRDINLLAYSGGDALYLAVGGGYATAPPTAPDVTVLLGIVEKSTADGELDVNIITIPNLNSLSDVIDTALADGNILEWNAASNIWDNVTKQNSGFLVNFEDDSTTGTLSADRFFATQDLTTGPQHVSLGWNNTDGFRNTNVTGVKKIDLAINDSTFQSWRNDNGTLYIFVNEDTLIDSGNTLTIGSATDQGLVLDKDTVQAKFTDPDNLNLKSSGGASFVAVNASSTGTAGAGDPSDGGLRVYDGGTSNVIEFKYNSFDSSADLINFNDDVIYFDSISPTTGARVSYKTEANTPTFSGLTEIIGTSANPLATDFGSIIIDSPDADFSGTAGGTQISVAPTGTLTETRLASNIVGVFGGVNGTVSSNGFGMPTFFGLQYSVSNSTDMVGGSKTGSFKLVGADITAILGASGFTVSENMPITSEALCGVADMQGTYNSTAAAAGFNAAIVATTTDNLLDIDSTGTDGSVINSYGVYVDAAPDGGGHTGTLNSYGIYNLNDVPNVINGDVRIGDAVKPGQTFEVNGISEIGDGGTTNYVEFDATGDVDFKGGSGLAFAEIFVEGSTATITVDSDIPDVIITQFDTNGESNNCTADVANDKITFIEEGKYMVTISVSVSISSGVTTELHIRGYLNGVEQTNVHSHRTLATTQVGSMSLSGIIDVTTSGWDLDVRANIDSSTARSLTVEDITLTAIQIGGT